jgi:hypothetical protein
MLSNSRAVDRDDRQKDCLGGDTVYRRDQLTAPGLRHTAPAAACIHPRMLVRMLSIPQVQFLAEFLETEGDFLVQCSVIRCRIYGSLRPAVQDRQLDRTEHPQARGEEIFGTHLARADGGSRRSAPHRRFRYLAVSAAPLMGPRRSGKPLLASAGGSTCHSEVHIGPGWGIGQFWEFIHGGPPR